MAKYPDMILDVANSQQLTGTYEVDTFHLKATHVAIGTVVINARKIIIDAGVQLNGIGTGYNYNQGPGTGGAHTQTSTGGYAGHYGGSGIGTSANNKKRDYGTKDGKDIDMGSGGGTIYGVSTAGRGGASITLNAEEITIAGVVSVNGNSGTSHSTYYGTGGGSGGGILIQAKHLTFTGSLNARGGAGGNYSSRSGYNGSGGRIKVFYETGTVTGAMDVMHGLAQGSTVQRFVGTTHTAVEAYTPVLDFASGTDIEVQVEDTATASVDTLEPTYTYIAGGNITVNAESSTMTVDGLNPTIYTQTGVDISAITAHASTSMFAPIIDLQRDQFINVDIATSTAHAETGRVEIKAPIFEDVIVSTEGTVLSGVIKAGLFHVTANTVYFEKDTVIHAHTIIIDGELVGNGRGHLGGRYASGDVGDGPGGGKHYKSYDGIYSYGGGSYGGMGSDGRYMYGTYGATYGDATSQTIEMGSGGSGTRGGNGGASITLNAKKITVNKSIYANGTPSNQQHVGLDGTNQIGGYGSAGGSGGGILIIGDEVEINQYLYATGGNASYSDIVGVGGGGRVKVFYDTKLSTPNSTLLAIVRGGTNTDRTGQDGTVHIAQAEYTPIISDGNMVIRIGEAASTQIEAFIPVDVVTVQHASTEIEVATATKLALIPRVEVNQQLTSTIATIEIEGILPTVFTERNAISQIGCSVANISTSTPQAIVDVEIQGETAQLSASALIAMVEDETGAFIIAEPATGFISMPRASVYAQRHIVFTGATATAEIKMDAPKWVHEQYIDINTAQVDASSSTPTIQTVASTIFTVVPAIANVDGLIPSAQSGSAMKIATIPVTETMLVPSVQVDMPVDVTISVNTASAMIAKQQSFVDVHAEVAALSTVDMQVGVSVDVAISSTTAVGHAQANVLKGVYLEKPVVHVIEAQKDAIMVNGEGTSINNQNSTAALNTEDVDYYIFQVPINDINLSDTAMTDLHLRLGITGLTYAYRIASLKITNFDFSVPPTITQLSLLTGTEVFSTSDGKKNEAIENGLAVRFTANDTLRGIIQSAKNAKRDYINLIMYATTGNVGVYTMRKNSPKELRPSLAFTKHVGVIEDSTIVHASVEVSTAQAETHDVVVDVVTQLQPVVEVPFAHAEGDALSCSLSTGVTIQSSYAFATARGLSPSGENSISTQVDADVASAYADLVLAQVATTRYETVSAELSTATIHAYPSIVAIDTEIIVDEPVDTTITQTYQPRITIDMAVQVEPSTAQTSASNADVDLQQVVYMETATASMEGLEVRLYLTRIEKETVFASLDTLVNQNAPNNSYYNSALLTLSSTYNYISTPMSYAFMRFPVREGATLIDSVLTVRNVEFKGNRGPTLIVSTLSNPFPSTGLTWNKMTAETRRSVATRSVTLELWGIEDAEVSIPIGLMYDKSFIYARNAIDVMIHRTVTESGTQTLASMEASSAARRPRMTHTYQIVETVGYTDVAVDAVSASATGSISAPRLSVGYSVDVPIAEASTTETRAEVRPGIGARIDADVAVATLDTNTPVFYLHDSDIMKVSNTGYAYATTFVPRPVVVRNAFLDVAPATAHADKLDMRVGISPNVRPTISSGIASANNPSTQTGMTVRMTMASSHSQAPTPQIKTTRTSAIRTITSTASVEALSTTFYIGLTPIIDVDVASVTAQAMSPELYIGLSPSTSATPAQATIETPAPSLYIGKTTHIHAVSATAQARGIVPTPFIQKENVLAQEKSAELSMVAIAPVVKTTEFISTSVDTATGMIEGVNPTVQTTIAIKASVATATTEMNKPTPFVKFDVDVAVDSVATMDERVSSPRISVGVSLPTNTAQATTDANSPSTSSHVAINTIRGYAYAQAPAPKVQLGKSASTKATFGYAYEQASTPKVRVDAVISTPRMDVAIDSHNPRIDIAYEVQLKTAQAFAYPLTPRIVRDVTVATDNSEILITALPAQVTGASNVKVISSATSVVDTSEVQVYADQHVEVKASVMVEEVSALAGKVQVSSFIRTDLSARATARGNNPAIDIRYNMTIPVAHATTQAIAPIAKAETACYISSDTATQHMQAVAPSTSIERATTIQTTQVATSAVYAMLAEVNARQATYVYPIPVEAYAQAMNAQATTNTTVQATSIDAHVTALSPKFELDKEQRAMIATGTATALTGSVQTSACINAPTSDSHIDVLVPSTFRETPVQMTIATATAHAQIKGTSAEYKGFQRTPAFYDGAISGTAQHETYEHDSSITMNARTHMTLRFDIRHLTKDSDIRQFAIDLKSDKLRTYSFAFMYVYTTTKPFDTAPTYYRSNGTIGEQIAMMSVFDNASNVSIGATATQNPKLLQYLRQCVSEGREYLDLFIGWSHSLGYEREFYLSESGLAPTLRIDHDTVLTTGFENARGIILEAPALQVEMLDVAVQTNLVATIEVDNAVASIDALPVRKFELDNLITTNVALTTANAVAPMIHATQADATSIPVATAHSSIIEMDVYTRAHAFIDAEPSSTHIAMLDVDAHATKVVKITAHLIDAEIEMAAPSIAIDATVKTLNVANETMDAPVATAHVDYTANPRFIYMTDEALTPSVQASCNVAIKAIPVTARGVARPPQVIGGRDAIFTIDNAWSTATTGITSVTVKAQQHITTTLTTSTARITTARPKVEANIGAIIYVDEATAHIEAPNGIEVNVFQAIVYADDAGTATVDTFAPSVETVSFMDVQSDVATMDAMMDAPDIINGHGVAVTMDCAETGIDVLQPSTQIDMPINVPASTGLAASSTPVAYVLYPNVDVNVAVAESIAEGNVPRIFVEQVDEVFVESAELIVDALVPSVQIREDVLFPIRVSVDHIDDKHNDNHLVLLERKEDRHIIFHVLEADGQPFAFEKHTAQFVVRDAKNKVVYTTPLVIDGDGLISLHWTAKDINKKGNYRGTIDLHDLSTAKTYRIPTDDYLIVTVLDTKKEKQRDDLLEDLFEEGQQQQIIEDTLTATEQTDEYNKRKEYDVDEIAKYFE